MTDTLDKIRQFAADAKAAHPPKKPFVQPEIGSYRPGRVLCFDQSLGSTGWAWLDCGRDGGLTAYATGLITSKRPPAKGFAWSMELSPNLFHEAAQVVRRVPPTVPVVIEMPAVFGQRTESSLIAANVLCCVLAELGRDAPVVISRQHACTQLVGYPDADKKITNAAVDRLIGINHTKPWNEHVRDAVVLGLSYLQGPQEAL